MTSSAKTAVVAASLASGGTESVGFLNDIVAQLWDYINVAGSKVTKEIVEPMFKEMLPGPLSSLHFTKIDLGKKPIKFDNIDVHSRKEGVIKLDIDVSWDGECDIELKANIIGSFGVEQVKLKGRMSVLLCPLVDRLPLVTAIQVAFINPPDLSLDFTGAANIADLAIIDNTIRKIIKDILASILVLPNRLLLKIDPSNEFYKTYQQHLGILRITVVHATGFVTPKGWFKDVPDVYCMTKFGASPVWTTSTKTNDVTPEWNESADFLLSDHDQVIEVEVMDDDLAGDDKLGKASITVGKLLLAGKSTTLPLSINGKPTGSEVEIKCDIFNFVADKTSFESPAFKGETLKCGLATILIAGLKNVPGEKEDAGACVKASFCSNNFQTPVIMDCPGIDCLNPSFDASFRVLMTSELAADPTDFAFTVVNRGKKLGTVEVKYATVLEAPGMSYTAKLPVGEGLELDVSINLSGVELAS